MSRFIAFVRSFANRHSNAAATATITRTVMKKMDEEIKNALSSKPTGEKMPLNTASYRKESLQQYPTQAARRSGVGSSETSAGSGMDDTGSIESDGVGNFQANPSQRPNPVLRTKPS